MKIYGIEIRDPSVNPLEYSFVCPACGCCHGFRTSPGEPRWTWNGDYEKPTISPSILVRSGNENGKTVCHMFVKDGMIQYLSDCTHSMAGKTVPMEDF